MRVLDPVRFAKASAGEDFQIEARGDAPGRALEAAAARWLQAHLDSGNDRSTTLARIDGAWWLLRAVVEDATDSAGRRRYHLVAARLEAPPEPRSAGALVLAAHQQDLPRWDGASAYTLEAGPAAPMNPATGLRAAIGVALGRSVPAVTDPADAGEALARLGLDAVDFVSLMPLGCPPAWPSPRGLAITSRAASADELEPALFARLAQADLAGLARLDAAPAHKLELLGAFGAAGDTAPEWRASDAELDWLLAHDVARAAALRHATGAQIGALIVCGALRAGELASVADRLDLGLVTRLRQDASCELDAASLALLDATAEPPAAPPPGWTTAWRPLLARAMQQPEFWTRWSGGVPKPLADWLAREVAAEDGGALARALAGALEPAGAASRVQLSAADLASLAPALSPEACLRQVANWAASTDAARGQALEALLGAGTLRPALVAWLRAELCSVEPAPPPPSDLTAAEMAVLLPYLHATRDVLRPVLARADREPGEDALLAALVAELRRTAAPPLPPPGEAARARRPDWVAALAGLPGWRAWRAR